jgi:hypothetical protein
MLVIQTIYGPKGRQIGYAVLNIETQARVDFKNRDYSYNWRRAKAAAEAYQLATI